LEVTAPDITADPDVYDFHMDRWTPDTLPMERLAEYLARLALLFGHGSHVHFLKVRKGSAVPEIQVDRQVAESVRAQLYLVKNHSATQDVLKVTLSINRLLHEDGASAYLKVKGGARIIEFPGVKTPLAEEAIVHESGELTGTVIRVGGKDDTVPLWLAASDGTVYKCNTNRALARDLARHLFAETVRVAGAGKWRRTEERTWELIEFKIKSWEPLVQTSLSELVNEIRQIEGSGWNQMDDPQGALRDLRED
jgi:hypothetical protein